MFFVGYSSNSSNHRGSTYQSCIFGFMSPYCALLGKPWVGDYDKLLVHHGKIMPFLSLIRENQKLFYAQRFSLENNTSAFLSMKIVRA